MFNKQEQKKKARELISQAGGDRELARLKALDYADRMGMAGYAGRPDALTQLNRWIKVAEFTQTVRVDA